MRCDSGLVVPQNVLELISDLDIGPATVPSSLIGSSSEKRHELQAQCAAFVERFIVFGVSPMLECLKDRASDEIR